MRLLCSTNGFCKVAYFVNNVTRTSRLVSHNLNITMPKQIKHTTVLQKQRQKLKEKGQKYTPGTINMQVLGSGSKGAPRSLYVFTDQARYLFNCGEGSQRLAHEHKMKLSKLEHIFVTYPSWENIGGLPGVALTIQDVGVPEITLHGPMGTDEIFAATRRFVILKDLSVVMANCSGETCFEDNVMTVQYVPVHGRSKDCSDNDKMASCTTPWNSGIEVEAGGLANRACSQGSTSGESEDDVDYYAHERNKNKRRHSHGTREKKRHRGDLDLPVKDMAVAMSYICRLKPRAGSLCLERCVEHGIPPGPLLGKLKAGEDVILNDGTLVRSKDVCLPDDPGPVFVVVECPDEAYVESLVNNLAYMKHQSTATDDENLAMVVVHFTPQSVVEDPRYKAWMERFAPSTQHLLLNDSNSCMGSVAVHRIQHKLHLLHPEVFPLLGDKSIPVKHSAENGNSNGSQHVQHATNSCEHQEKIAIIQGRTLCTVHLRPRKGIDKQPELELNTQSFVEETEAVEGFSDALAELRQELSHLPKLVQHYPQIVFLGTGSCIPNKTRNTSAILLHTSESDCILLDCGEGTYGQLVRFYGTDKVDAVMRNLRAVYVSHLHADHHIGLIGILKNWRLAVSSDEMQQHSPLLLLAPKQIMSWLNFYHNRFEPILQDIELLPNGDLKKNCPSPQNTELYHHMLEKLNMSDINTVIVKHCPNAFGVAMTHNSGWKLAYSGDTMPCDQFVDLGLDCDLLIHEATMEDDLQVEACAKLHSTTSEAIDIGRRMRAKFTLLTHFSQRYAKLPRFTHNFSSNVGIAFDNMQVRLGDLPVLPLLYPSLKLMFADHYEEMEQKAAKRIMKKEREQAAVNT